ncbi:MAG: DNA-directed RNA polymerase subunit alpha [Betaproteobacteria bacterium]|nr:DNA-directed RNA polymerase subunit alpha [Betaproteobacteria bacterium]
MPSTLLKPTISESRSLGPLSSRVTVEPLERGFGHTLGNALRRVAMSSIPGYAATEIKISGVMHECDRVDGMREEVIWLILNIKNIIFKMHDSAREVVRVVKEGPCSVTAGDIQLPHNVEIANPDSVLATLTKGGKLDMEITVEKGAGYQPAMAMEKESRRVGVIHLDASFAPVKRMSFTVGSTRHENRVDLDRLVMEIESNGIYSCEEIVQRASQILIDQFQKLVELGGYPAVAEAESAARPVEVAHNPLFNEKVDILELTVRSQNCLRQENIRYIGELVQKTERDMMRTPNLGRKSLLEIKQALGKHSLDIGVEMPNWKPHR